MRYHAQKEITVVFARSLAQRSRWSTMVAVALAFSLLIGSPGGIASVALAQPPAPAPDESAEDATVALLPYLLREEDAPADYQPDYTRGYTNDAEALEDVTIVPPVPRPAEDPQDA